MAKLSDLVRTIADATEETTASVTVVARFLREAGLITTGGRGLNAARMGSHDLASLLLGITSPGESIKAGETVARVGQMLLEPVAQPNDRSEYSYSPIFIEEHEAELGLKCEMPLIDCLAVQIDRYLLDPTPPREPKPPSIDPLNGTTEVSDDVFAFRGSTLPKSISIKILQSVWGWEASLQMQLCGGDRLSLLFSPSGQPRLNRARETKEKPPKRWLVELSPEVIHQAVLCLRDQLPAEQNVPMASKPR